MTINQIAEDAIGLFVETVHACGLDVLEPDDVERATIIAMSEVAEGTAKLQAALDSLPKCPTCGDPLPVERWQGDMFLRLTECSECRERAEAASVPDPATATDIPF